LSAQSPSSTSSRSLDQLHHDIDAILGAPLLERGLWGVVIKPLDRDETWYSRNGAKLMMPASNMKIVTLAAAAEKIGWDYTYETKLFAAGRQRRRPATATSSWSVRATRTSTTGTATRTRLFSEWATQLKAAGIRRSTGASSATTTRLKTTIGLGWAWDDLPAGFAAGVSASSSTKPTCSCDWGRATRRRQGDRDGLAAVRRPATLNN
jgi:D-alanyl-D-alanine carboxypeptidase/D-alanyl-D-alanine-endopeptidase (penicillin-binding protein 4)